ncbi:MAG: Menaquinone-cytochrome C oxidoreductase, cytochrome C subunit, partial [uncultured Rubrobacteraceae bacterium]
VRSSYRQAKASRARGDYRRERLRATRRDDRLFPEAGPLRSVCIHASPAGLRGAVVPLPRAPFGAGGPGDDHLRAAAGVVLLLLRADAHVLPRLRPDRLWRRRRANRVRRAAIRGAVAGPWPEGFFDEASVRHRDRASRRRYGFVEHVAGRQPYHQLPGL